ncbi:GNAT family N-acetyltransferase [Microbulbifer marinus]|uniref:Acetyltransferase involved in cellulose biosynthesis, CelD/BcsL family n=1 Tax=Microbulbifer marinus TaxID=658218 RepID=A0A1H4AM04_9GAMM|nr:GNAT family N-acetyltransferase [Microbulbifer marinus]SEA36714.1 Acetyltransferase involved in cellulose biosynthesis, CelD/BcsL family [Microbulbifer marinus]
MSTTEEINETRSAARESTPKPLEPDDRYQLAVQGPRIERSINGARALLESWEKVDHKGAPRSSEVAAFFHLPYLSKRQGQNTPFVALWEKNGMPDGILIGRHSLRRPKLSFLKMRVLMPRLRVLEIGTGGLEAYSYTTAQQQAAYLRHLLVSGKVDRISIYNLPLDTDIGQALHDGLRYVGDGNPESAGHWFAELTDSAGNPIASNSAKTRSSFRRMDRKLCQFFNHKVEIQEFHSPDQVADFIKVAARIGECTYQSEIGVGVKDDAMWHNKLGLYAASGNLRAYLLLGGGKPLAYAVGALWESTYTGFATSFLPEYSTVSPGGYLLRRMIEQFQQDGVRWFDFGAPDYGYKKVYGTMRREIISMHYSAKTPAALTATILDATVKKSEHAIRHILEASGLMARLRRMRQR